MKDYRECHLWEKSRSLLFSIYRITEHYSAEQKKCVGNQLQNYCIENLSNIVKCCNRRRNRSGRLLKNSMFVMDKLERSIQHAFGLHILNENDFQYLNQEMSDIKMLISASNVKSET